MLGDLESGKISVGITLPKRMKSSVGRFMVRCVRNPVKGSRKNNSPVWVLRHLSGKARGLRILLVWKGRATSPDRMDRRPNRRRYSFASPIHAGLNQKVEAGCRGMIYTCRRPHARAMPSRYWSHNFKPSSKRSKTRVDCPLAIASLTMRS